MYLRHLDMRGISKRAHASVQAPVRPLTAACRRSECRFVECFVPAVCHRVHPSAARGAPLLRHLRRGNPVCACAKHPLLRCHGILPVCRAAASVSGGSLLLLRAHAPRVLRVVECGAVLFSTGLGESGSALAALERYPNRAAALAPHSSRATPASPNHTPPLTGHPQRRRRAYHRRAHLRRCEAARRRTAPSGNGGVRRRRSRFGCERPLPSAAAFYHKPQRTHHRFIPRSQP